MKKKLAFVDLTNFKNWPMGGMIQYELSILPEICKHYDVDLWGVSVNGKSNKFLMINGKKYAINLFANCKTSFRILPNYWRGLSLFRFKKQFNKYDIIYAHTGSCIVPFLNMKNVKKVYHQHGLMYLNDNSLKTKLEKPFMDLAQQKSDLVFVVSGEKSTKNFYESKNLKNRFISIDSPVTFSELAKISVRNKKNKNKPQKYIYTGRLTKFKNVDFLIDAFSKYLTDNKEAILTIVGEGEEYKNIKHKINKYGLEKSILLKGRVKHEKIKELLMNNDVFLMPSKGEGVSVSVAEANTFGLPVVVQDVVGLNEQVKENVNGTICLTNSIKSFVNGIKKIENIWPSIVDTSYEYSLRYKDSAIADKIIYNIDNIYSVKGEKNG